MSRPALCILDQWASRNTALGTSKNWLYGGMSKVFDVDVINADIGAPARLEQAASLFRAMLSHPFSLRRQYHHELQWAAKRLPAFKARTRRFQQVVDGLQRKPDLLMQIGCLFGPLVLPGVRQVSYHDQNIALVERYWPQWLPPDFPKFRETWMQLEGAALQSKDLVLTYSERTRQSMIMDYGLAPDRVAVAHTACKMSYPTPEDVLGPRREAVLFATTDFLRKGGDIMLDAFKRLRKVRPMLELLLVGGPVPVALPQGARHLGLLPHAELRTVYLSSSLILHPARHDAFPNVLKEAQACGLPAVASDSLGIPEIVTHGRTGLILKKLDSTALAQATLELLEDSPRLASMRHACLEDRARFQPDRCVANIVGALRNSLAREAA